MLEAASSAIERGGGAIVSRVWKMDSSRKLDSLQKAGASSPITKHFPIDGVARPL